MTSDRGMRLPDVLKMTGVSKTYLYGEINARRFPAPCKLSVKLSIWLESEVQQWLREQAAKREKA